MSKTTLTLILKESAHLFEKSMVELDEKNIRLLLLILDPEFAAQLASLKGDAFWALIHKTRVITKEYPLKKRWESYGWLKKRKLVEGVVKPS